MFRHCIGCISIKCCTDIHGPQRIHPNNFGDSSYSATMRLTLVGMSENIGWIAVKSGYLCFSANYQMLPW